MKHIPIGLVTIMLLFAACNSPKDSNEKRIISVSILPQKYFVESLAGDEFDINVLVPPGNSPASYDPSPKQLRDLSKSEAYLKVGHLGFEKAWMGSIMKNHSGLKIYDLSAGINLIQGEETAEENAAHGHDHSHAGMDPHIWMSPKTALLMAENTAKAIILFDPTCQGIVRQNLEKLKVRINNLSEDFQNLSDNLENKKFIIFHPALTYLARDYGLEQIPMEFEGKEPSAVYMRELIDKAKAEDIKTVFIQKEFNQDNARQISKDLNARLVQIDPLAEDWEVQMRDLLQAFK